MSLKCLPNIFHPNLRHYITKYKLQIFLISCDPPPVSRQVKKKIMETALCQTGTSHECGSLIVCLDPEQRTGRQPQRLKR